MVGFQEMVELGGANVLLTQAGAPVGDARRNQWVAKIGQCINQGIPANSSRRLEVVESGVLVGVMLCVFVTREIATHMSEVAVNSAGVGIGGFLGNKGGVAVRFRAYDRYFCFFF